MLGEHKRLFFYFLSKHQKSYWVISTPNPFSLNIYSQAIATEAIATEIVFFRYYRPPWWKDFGWLISVILTDMESFNAAQRNPFLPCEMMPIAVPPDWAMTEHPWRAGSHSSVLCLYWESDYTLFPKGSEKFHLSSRKFVRHWPSASYFQLCWLSALSLAYQISVSMLWLSKEGWDCSEEIITHCVLTCEVDSSRHRPWVIRVLPIKLISVILCRNKALILTWLQALLSIIITYTNSALALQNHCCIKCFAQRLWESCIAV